MKLPNINKNHHTIEDIWDKNSSIDSRESDRKFSMLFPKSLPKEKVTRSYLRDKEEGSRRYTIERTSERGRRNNKKGRSVSLMTKEGWNGQTKGNWLSKVLSRQ